METPSWTNLEISLENLISIFEYSSECRDPPIQEDFP